VLPTPQNTTKISQFNERIDKKCGVWCKWVQCSVMGDLKQIKLMSLRSLIVAFLPPEYKEVL
jgi:predicted amino acid racemase